MRDYLFVLGRDRELSLLELSSYFKSRDIEFKLKESIGNIAIFNLPELDFSSIIKDLGGTIKIGEIIFSGDKTKIKKELDKFNLNFSKNKIVYSISIYNNSSLRHYIEDYLKYRFKNEKIKAIRKRSQGQDTMPSVLIKNKILEEGFELLIFSRYIAKTIAVFNPFEYKERDKRPCNDFLKGSSIRLSKILINLSQVKPNQVLLDPFCGVGIILQEALLMGINVIGSDVDKASVEASKKNCEWIIKKYNLNKKFKIFQEDARNLNRILKEKVDVIVTEPYLGPYIKKLPSEGKAKEIVFELEKLYSLFFKNIYQTIKENGIIVFIVPKFKTFNKKIIGLNLLNILDNKFRLLRLDTNIKSPIKYLGYDAKIIRQIYILQKSNKTEIRKF